MGKSAKFMKRPTRKEKAVLSLTKETTETSLFDAATSEGPKSAAAKNKKDSTLSTTANRTISKKSTPSSGSGVAATVTAGHPPKASLAYKMQLHGGIKHAVKDLENLDSTGLESDEDEDEDVDMDDEDADTMDGSNGSNNHHSNAGNSKKKESLDKSKPRPDYIELMYGKPQTKNKRKTFMPKPALIK